MIKTLPLLMACASISFLANAQTKKVKLSNPVTHAVETFYVLKNDAEIREGKYNKKQKGADVKGQYTNNQRSGIWEFIGRNGLEQRIDFDSNKVLFAKPFNFVKNFYVRENENYKEVTPDEHPLFLGGTSAIYSLLQQTIRYPASARRMGIDGKVKLSAVITTEGNFTQLKVEESLSPDTDAEALRIIGLLPNTWLPGKVNGQLIDLKIIFHIAFKLEI